MSHDSKDTPLVSIACTTYNQAGYIRECLDGLIMQKTNFKFEILIHDDASTDGTDLIIKEYQSKYPDLIFPILQSKNQFSSGIKGILVTYIFPKCQGKYIALCEGDDFWTDQNKLQIQTDFLEKYPNHSICFHPVRVFFENSKKADSVFPISNKSSDFTFESLLKANFIQTNSVMYRKQNYKKAATNVNPGDWYLHLYHAQFGKIGFINKVMSAYRRHSGGIWWKDEDNKVEFWERNALDHLNFYNEVLKLVEGKDSQVNIVKLSLDSLISMVVDDCASDNSYSVIKSIMSKYPDFIGEHIYRTRMDNIELNSETVSLRSELSDKVTRLGQAESQLKDIRGSNGWKVLDFFYTTRNKLLAKKK